MTVIERTVSRRIEWIDLARGVALIAMAIYHFSWDLEFFGYLDPGTAGTGPLKWFARSIAASFLILVGIGLILAHGNGIRWRGYWRRLTIVAAAAAAITVATYFATPGAFVFFGILHQITIASLFGLAFIRFPAIALLLLAGGWFMVMYWAKSDFFTHPALVWLGLAPFPPRSNDFVPMFPWFAMVLAGMAAGRAMLDSGLAEYLSRRDPVRNVLTRSLRFLGRHSLITYLVHQPILISMVYLASLAAPPAPPVPEEAFFDSCHRSCLETGENAFCTAFCACAITRLTENGLFDDVFRGEITQQSDPRVALVSDQCSSEAGLNGN
jgi:uncharacterized membrane protein